MSDDDRVKVLEVRVAELERELRRVTKQRNQAWKDRKEIHNRLRTMTAREKHVEHEDPDQRRHERLAGECGPEPGTGGT